MEDKKRQRKTELGNTKEARKWFFTLNNYTVNDIKNMEDYFKKGKYVFQEETGTSGTPHLQGYVEWKSSRKFVHLKKKFPTCHWEVCRNKKASIEYCSKMESRSGKTYSLGIELPEPIECIDEKKLYKWQQEIVDLCKTKPDKRTVNWYWDEKGCKGKTELARLLVLKYKALVVGGKRSDMFNAILTVKNTTKKFPKIIIIDIPRCSENFVSYAAIEKIKDGLFYSGKYEGGMVIMNRPHVICMANFEPDKLMLSEDRWNIVEID